MGHAIRAANLWGYDALVRDLGGDPEPLLARLHLPPQARRPDDAYLPFRSFARLLETTAVALECPDLGMRLSQHQGLAMLGPIAVVARHAGTVADAFDQIAAFLHIHSPALRLWREPRAGSPGAVRFGYRVDEPGAGPLPQSWELSLANGVQIIRLLAGPQAAPALVAFHHPRQADPASYAACFGCPVRFESDWAGVEVGRDLARRRLDHADPQTLEVVAAFLDSRIPPGEATTTSRVRELLERLLPTGRASMVAVAEQMAVHPRTLQRRLREEGTRYDAVLDETRRDLAQHYLTGSDARLSQVTGLLGYGDQSALTHACRRWFGVTPLALRRGGPG